MQIDEIHPKDNTSFSMTMSSRDYFQLSKIAHETEKKIFSKRLTTNKFIRQIMETVLEHFEIITESQPLSVMNKRNPSPRIKLVSKSDETQYYIHDPK